MIYFDNAATTKPYDFCLEDFCNLNKTSFFNASAGYLSAFNIFKKNEEAKKNIMEILGGDGNLIFTSGATESNNLAILGSSFDKTKRYLFSIGEHPSVYNTALELKNKGFCVEFIPLQKNGQIDYEKFENMMDENVAFVSTMFVSNETGAINDLKKIRNIIDKSNKNCTFHVDAVQGFCKIKFCCKDLNINLCSISCHKIGGIKGVGALYISKNTKLKNINYGGGQENNLRSGTINACGNIVFGENSKFVYQKIKENYDKVENLKKYLITKLEEDFKNSIFVSNFEGNSPYVISILFPNKRGETIMRFLSSEDILVGTGSACSSSKIGNRILENMGYKKNEVMGAIRISFCPENTKEEIDIFISKLKLCLEKLEG